MIPSSSKFYFAFGTVLLLTAAVYGWTTGGDFLGPLSFGYKGGVGDLLGYSILVGTGSASLFLGFVSTALRDADPEAGAALLGVEHDPAPPAPGTSYWPAVGAFGLGLVIVGVALNSVFFVAGLIVLGTVALEWTMQAWADRATGDPAVNREIRNRLMLPLEVPLAGVLVVLLVVFGFSRLFLSVSAEGAVWAALVIALVFFVVGTVLASRPQLRSDLVAGLLAVAAVATLGIGIASAVAGERDFEHHGEEHGEETEPEEGEGTDAENGDDPTEDGEEAPVEEGN